jgi:hypothetical protein
MKTLNPGAILLFYDYPQVFLGTDSVDTLYACMVSLENEDGPSYACTPVSRRSATELSQGRKDLRSVFEHPELPEFYKASFVDDLNGSLLMQPAGYTRMPVEMLPEAGLVFNFEDEVAISASDLNTTVSFVSLNVPEAATEARIRATTLAGFLGIYQTAIQYLARTQAKRAKRPLKRDDDSFSADVYGFAKGSFTVKFRGSNETDIFGEIPAFSAAMQKLTEFLLQVRNPAEALDFLQSVKGHTASSLIRLLEFLSTHTCPIKVEWATPSMRSAVRVEADLGAIRELVARCRERSDLSIEEVTITGRLEAARHGAGTWTMISEEDNEPYSGDIHPESSVTVSGMRIEQTRYQFVCEETIEVVNGTGKEVRHLALKTVKVLDN